MPEAFSVAFSLLVCELVVFLFVFFFSLSKKDIVCYSENAPIRNVRALRGRIVSDDLMNIIHVRTWIPDIVGYLKIYI